MMPGRHAWTPSLRIPALALAWLVFAIVGCHRPTPTPRREHQHQAPPPTRPPGPGQCTSAPALPKRRFAFRWLQQRTYALEFFADGELRKADRVVGRVEGSCILDASGGVLRSVGTDGIVYGPADEKMGTLGPRRAMRREGMRNRYPVGEVLVTVSGTVMGVSDQGSPLPGALQGVVFTEDDAGSDEDFNFPLVEGDFVLARRTALLVLTTDLFDERPDPLDAGSALHPVRLPNAGECRQSPSLSTGAFALALQEDAGLRRLEVTPSGEVHENGLKVATVSGACVLDAHDYLVAVVDRDDQLRGSEGQWLGSFEAPDAEAGAEARTRAGEAFVSPEGTPWRLEADGAVVQGAPGSSPLRVGRFDGDPAASRRAALLLLYERAALSLSEH